MNRIPSVRCLGLFLAPFENPHDDFLAFLASMAYSYFSFNYVSVYLCEVFSISMGIDGVQMSTVTTARMRDHWSAYTQ